MLLAAGRVGIEAQLAMGLQPLAWALCALIHEAAHSVVAKRTGLRVRIIALRPAGGVTVYDGNTVSDREQVWISGAGPAASLALAVLAIGGAMCSSGSLGQALRFLACFNVAVFAFNALPALPLDGGRVARAVLSMRGQTVTQTHRTLERLRGASGYSLGALGAGLIVLAPFSPLTMTVCGVVLLWTGWTLIPGDGCKDRGRPDARAD
jgi:Zn-dependent protease